MTMMINNKKDIKLIVKKVLILTLVFTLCTTFVFASGDSGKTVGEIVTDINNGQGVYRTIQEIMGILAWLGFALAIGKMMQIGIMYMIGTSVGKVKNDAKAALMPWIVGCLICVLFGTVGPWVIGIFMEGNSGSPFDI